MFRALPSLAADPPELIQRVPSGSARTGVVAIGLVREGTIVTGGAGRQLDVAIFKRGKIPRGADVDAGPIGDKEHVAKFFILADEGSDGAVGEDPAIAVEDGEGLATLVDFPDIAAGIDLNVAVGLAVGCLEFPSVDKVGVILSDELVAGEGSEGFLGRGRAAQPSRVCNMRDAAPGMNWEEKGICMGRGTFCMAVPSNLASWAGELVAGMAQKVPSPDWSGTGRNEVGRSEDIEAWCAYRGFWNSSEVIRSPVGGFFPENRGGHRRWRR